jgi:small subunit ribosomal protein S16
MAVKIRLTRKGKKKQPTYRVVVADSRAPRDGRYIEQIGRYDPRPDPSVVEIDDERARYWLGQGAQPSDAVRRLLEITGVLEATRVRTSRVHVVGEEAQVAADVEEAAPGVAEEPEFELEGDAAAPEASDAAAADEAGSAEQAEETEQAEEAEETEQAEEAEEPEQAKAAEEAEEAEQAEATGGAEEAGATEEAAQTEEAGNETKGDEA